MDNDLYLSCDDKSSDHVCDDHHDDYGYDDDDDEFLEEPDDNGDYVEELDEQTRKASGSCKVITRESLMAAQKDDLKRVMDLLSVKEHYARTLLIHFRWNAYKIVDILSERGEECLFSAAGVPMAIGNNVPSSHSVVEVICQICFDAVLVAETTTMDCGHRFCNNCWREHFIVKINEGQSRRITCMAHKCMAICDDSSIRSLVGAQDHRLAEKFDRYLFESYIEDNKLVKWCPSVPHCGNAIRVETDEYCEVECACGLQFCFNCLFEAHSPCSCLMWQLWTKKCKDESETVNWLTTNAKYCPKCHKPVEKTGGCNLVTCVCGQYFCWLCGGATGSAHTFTSIEGHSCGRYKEDQKNKVELARKQLWRYTHYFNRFKAHRDSLKEEIELKKKAQEKVEELEATVEKNPVDFSWVGNGIHRLWRSRRILSYSYTFAYFMFGDELFNEMTRQERQMKQNLFEDHQQQLEANVEKLSKHLEENFSEYSKEDLYKMKMRIIALSDMIDNFCKGLFEFIDNDLLGTLQQSLHIVAPYKSNGAEKAATLCEE